MGWKLVGWLRRGKVRKCEWLARPWKVQADIPTRLALCPRPGRLVPAKKRKGPVAPQPSLRTSFGVLTSLEEGVPFSNLPAQRGTIWNLSAWSGLLFVPKDPVCGSSVRERKYSCPDCGSWFPLSHISLFDSVLSDFTYTSLNIVFCYFGQESIMVLIALTWDPESHQVIT